jgi:hypothetical protein
MQEDRRMKRTEAFARLIALAAAELDGHNSAYDHHTPEAVIEELRRVTADTPARELEAILDRCRQHLQARRPPPGFRA